MRASSVIASLTFKEFKEDTCISDEGAAIDCPSPRRQTDTLEYRELSPHSLRSGGARTGRKGLAGKPMTLKELSLAANDFEGL